MRLLSGTSGDGAGRFIGDWIAERIPQIADGKAFGAYAAFGVLSAENEMLGGVLFNNYHPDMGNIEVSFAAAGKRWLTPEIITKILSYPYAQLECLRVTSVTPRRAASARRFLERFGFRREGLIRRGFRNDDAIISGLLREEWDESRFNVARKPRGGELDGQVLSPGSGRA